MTRGKGRARMAALAGLLLMPFAGATFADDQVKTTSGIVEGVRAASPAVRAFRGIPFAAPPVGELRWKAPQPVVPWTGVKSADTFGPQCMQQPYPEASPYATPSQPTSEDCLYLNVYTAAKNGDRRPVMVWIHGGAWTRGSGSTPVYNGTTLSKKG